MTRTTIVAVLALLLLADSAAGATLRAKLVNRTTGEIGHADSVRLVDVAQGMSPLMELEDVRGEFTMEGVPETAAHLLLQIEKDGISYSQSIPGLDPEQVLEVDVYDVGEDTSDLRVGIHHVLFQRNGDHLMVTELFEFENESDPPLALPGDLGAIRVHVPHEFHGELEASVGSGTMPIRLPVVSTAEAAVYTVDYALKPGPTRLILRYQLHYGDHLQWEARALYPEEDRRVLVSPPDISVEAAQMIPTESQMEGFAAYAGLPVEVGESWSVHLHGGSQVASGAPGGRERATGPNEIVRVAVRPNPLFEQKGLVLVALSIFLMAGLILGITTGPKVRAADVAGENSAQDKLRERLSRLADRYVSGEIDRLEFEQERDRILGSKSKHRTNGASAQSPAATSR